MSQGEGKLGHVIAGGRFGRLGTIAVAVPLAAAVILLGAVSAGAVSLHALTPKGCIAAPGDLAGCGATANGLSDPRGVATSPDGASVYAVSTDHDAIVRFDRAANGALSNPSCIADVGDVAGCGATAQGLEGAFAVAVSPDGASVYAVSAGDDAVVRFDRAANGALSNPSCIADVGDAAGCGTTAQGLNSPRALAISPDGTSLYAAGNFDDAIVRFDRAANGALSNPSCIADVGDVAGCGTTAQGLDAARGLAVSPDGTSFYVAADVDDTIVHFHRAPGGALSAPNCIADVGDAAGCGATAEGLNGAKAMAISPDGESVYVASISDNAIVHLDRAQSGALSAGSCIEDIGGTAGCATSTQGLEDARAVVVSDDGASVYAVSGDDSAIVSFDRAPGGALSAPSCIADVGDIAGCGATAEGLENPQDLVASPDGSGIYAVSSSDSAIVSFAREVPPDCRTSSSTGVSGEVQTVSLDCSDPNGDPLTIEVVSEPINGTLGEINQAAGTVDYTPDGGFSGADSFDIRAIADGKASNVSTVVIAVQPATGPPGPPGPPGAQGPQSPPGRDATVSCKTKRKKVKCNVTFAAAAGVQRARLSRRGLTYAVGKPKPNQNGELVLRFRRAEPLTAGKYTLTVVQRVNGDKLVTRSRVRVT